MDCYFILKVLNNSPLFSAVLMTAIFLYKRDHGLHESASPANKVFREEYMLLLNTFVSIVVAGNTP